MEDRISLMLKQNLYMVWHNGGIFKDRIQHGFFIIHKAVRLTAHQMGITEQQIVDEVSVYKMGDMLRSL